METATRPARWKILIAFAVIYFVWGSTFLFIRIGVRQVPPFLLAAARFTIAGGLLYLWMRFQGVPSPSRREWMGSTALGTLMFLIDYGCLFWAEQRVPSGVAAVVLATIPVFITLLEIIFLRTSRLSLRLSVGLLVGILGVVVLMNHSFGLREPPINWAGAIALLVSSAGWSVGTILSRKLQLPDSKAMSAAAQMLTGGLQLFVLTAVSGEFSRFHPQQVSWQGWFSLVYLIIAGSLIGFTAYVWLLHYESPTVVGTYAYVNPLVAVTLGYLVGGEALGLRTALGTALVLVSVALITTMRPSARRVPVAPGAAGNQPIVSEAAD